MDAPKQPTTEHTTADHEPRYEQAQEPANRLSQENDWGLGPNDNDEVGLGPNGNDEGFGPNAPAMEQDTMDVGNIDSDLSRDLRSFLAVHSQEE